tara:strand:- start:117 stop:512 length:396 start_codon:yes stop_codon:yes gene_type:complete
MKSTEAFLSIALATIAADGVLHEQEAISLREALNTQSAFKSVDISSLIKEILIQIKAKGIDAVAEEAISCLSLEQQETAIATATHLAHSDKLFCEREDAFLNKLSVKSKIPNDKAKSIIDSIILLHRDVLT